MSIYLMVIICPTDHTSDLLMIITFNQVLIGL